MRLPISSISARLSPYIFIPTGVRMPVASMSVLPFMGIVQAFTSPGIFMAESICAISSSQVVRSGQNISNGHFKNPGTIFEYHLPRAGQLSCGLNCTVVSIMESGAGSVEVSALPAFPNTLATSGKDLSILS